MAIFLLSRELGTTSIPYSANREPASTAHQPLAPLAPPSGPLAYGGGAEGRKRRSPSSYRGKASKLSRPGGLESLFGNGSDGGGILAVGPESPRQVGTPLMNPTDFCFLTFLLRHHRVKIVLWFMSKYLQK